MQEWVHPWLHTQSKEPSSACHAWNMLVLSKNQQDHLSVTAEFVCFDSCYSYALHVLHAVLASACTSPRVQTCQEVLMKTSCVNVVPLSEPQRRSSCQSGWPAHVSHTGRPGTLLRSAPGEGWWYARCWLVTQSRDWLTCRDCLQFTIWSQQTEYPEHRHSESVSGLKEREVGKAAANFSALNESYVGSFARFRNRQTLSIEPFSSKSDLKKRAVSMLTWSDTSEWYVVSTRKKTAVIDKIIQVTNNKSALIWLD